MQYVIPDVPSEVLFRFFRTKKAIVRIFHFQLKTQIQRETMLAKEAKYEHGLKKTDYEYDDLISTLRDNNNASRNERSVGKFFFAIKKAFQINDCFSIKRFLGAQIKQIIRWFRCPRRSDEQKKEFGIEYSMGSYIA